MNITALLAGLFSGIIASMGMGGGAVLLIYLTAFLSVPQLNAQGINLIFFIPIGIMSVIIYVKQKKIKFKSTIPLAVFGVVGSLAGIWVTRVLDGAFLGKIFAFFLIFLGISEIFKKDKNTP
ncbi:MAG: sulfite exporter TauE/SafE family protein [Clostridia bacterium]|nr:sulfite exporter TauE/SafE family protein [Clostridia bacterium]